MCRSPHYGMVPDNIVPWEMYQPKRAGDQLVLLNKLEAGLEALSLRFRSSISQTTKLARANGTRSKVSCSDLARVSVYIAADISILDVSFS